MSVQLLQDWSMLWAIEKFYNIDSRRSESRVVLKNGLDTEMENFSANVAKILFVQVKNIIF